MYFPSPSLELLPSSIIQLGLPLGTPQLDGNTMVITVILLLVVSEPSHYITLPPLPPSMAS